MSRSESETSGGVWSLGWWRHDGRWLALASVGLIFFGLSVYGAQFIGTSLAICVVAPCLLGLTLAFSDRRKELGRLRRLGTPAILFLLVLAAVGLSFTAWTPDGPRAAWVQAGLAPGAATVDKSNTAFNLIRLLGLGCLFALGLTAGASDSRARVSIGAFLAVGVALAGWSFADLAGGGQRLGARRLDGPFDSPNALATLAGTLLVLALGMAVWRYRGAGPGDRLVSVAPPAAAALVMVMTLLATGSRAGGISAAAGLLVFLGLQAVAGKITWSRAMVAATVALVLAAGVIAVAGDILMGRLAGEALSDNSRTTALRDHWEAFRAAPLLGYGLGNFDVVNRMLLDDENIPYIWNFRAAHNVYLNWLELGGLLAALPMFGCIGAVIFTTARAAFRRTRMTALLFALLAADAVVLVHGMTDFALEIFGFAALWAFLLGLQFSLAQGPSRR